MNNRKNQITSKQLMSFVIATQLGTGMLWYPNSLAMKVGHDGWISVIIFGSIITFFIVFMILLLKRYENQNIFSINKNIYGKVIGFFINNGIIVYLFILTCISLRIFINIVKLIALPLTPGIIVTIFTFLPSLYLVSYGLKFIARDTIFAYYAILFCLIIFFLESKDFHFTFLQPIGKCGVNKIISTTPESLHAFLGYELIAIIYPEITNKNKVMIYSICANFVTTIMYIIITIVSTIVLGENFLKSTLYPIINLSRYYEAPIFQRIDLFFLATWFFIMAMDSRAYFFAAYYSINKVYDLKMSKIFLFCFWVVVIAATRFPNSDFKMHYCESIMEVLGAIVTINMLLCYILSFIRKKGIRTNDKVF